MTELPTGTVTFLFTDIEGSTLLLQELGDAYGAVQDDHMRLMREAIASGGGVEIRTEGDAFFAVFPSAPGAVRAAVAALRSFASHAWTHGEPIRVRMGMHTGEGRRGGDDYLGLDVNRAARIAAAGHGGQVLLSEATRGLVANELPEGVGLQDLGSHRLKDLRHPEHLHQLVIAGLQADFPPLKTLEIPSNVPAELTSFVGREREVEQIKGILEGTRLLTLTGPGGSGKTRLAVRAAAELVERFRDGVFVVELAPIGEAQLVPSAIAASLGLRDIGPRPVLETLQHELRDRESLIVLDNFEQVVDAAPVVGSLLAAATRLRTMVTSRTVLRVQGEREFPVQPLGVPGPSGHIAPADLIRYEAVALFVERAAAMDASFVLTEQNAEAVAGICRRLEGLPLAIELAASRIRLLPPQAMLERLDRALPLLAGSSRDLPDRQRTLRGAISWSYDLLPEELRALFRRLCVFAGGFTLDSVEPVVDPNDELGVDVLTGVESLLDNSLVRRREATPGMVRFDMLQTIREFGLERLDEEDSGEALHRRHAEFFLGVAEAGEAKLRGPEGQGHFAGLTAEADNLRAALAWAIRSGEGEAGLRLVAALWRVWHWRGELSAGRRWADEVLALPSAQARTIHRARALAAAGGLAYWQQDARAVRAWYEEALSIAEELGDAAEMAEGTYNLGFAFAMEGVMDRAEELFRRSKAMFDQLGERRGIGDALFALSFMDRLAGNAESARSKAEDSFRLHEKDGDFFGMLGATFALGRASAELGDLDRARSLFLRILEGAGQMGDRTSVAVILDNLADEEIARGHSPRAIRLAGASAALKEAVGGQAPPELINLSDPRDAARSTLSEEEIQAAWQEGRAMTLEAAVAYAREPSAD
jgi:predicted ATPase/class 3 adenylate cyclase